MEAAECRKCVRLNERLYVKILTQSGELDVKEYFHMENLVMVA